MMKIRVRLFAAFKELLGKNELDASVPEGANIEDLKRVLKSEYPQIIHLLDVSRFAINMQYKDNREKLSDGDEVTIIMPVSGGIAHKNRFIEITGSAINVSKVLNFIENPAAGSVLLFNGTVRNNEDGKPVKFLFYEAYKEMALKEIDKLVDNAFKDYELLKVAVIHRTGKIEIGEISISIGVSSPHREHSYLASKYLIDNIKETVPIWKKESFENYNKWKKI